VFTGLVTAKGTVSALARDAEGLRLRVATELGPELAGGDSVAVNGVCLTAVDVDLHGFAAEVMGETLRRSALGPLTDGDEVNLELPLRLGDRLGGHLVQGHVDGTGKVDSVRHDGFARVARVLAPPHLLRYLVAKGSIAVDGVSLTVVEVDGEGFSVSLIPETLERTTLGGLAPGRIVNLEVDLVAKYVESLLPGHSARAPAAGAASTRAGSQSRRVPGPDLEPGASTR
jgi:riboflavin synthase